MKPAFCKGYIEGVCGVERDCADCEAESVLIITADYRVAKRRIPTRPTSFRRVRPFGRGNRR